MTTPKRKEIENAITPAVEKLLVDVQTHPDVQIDLSQPEARRRVLRVVVRILARHFLAAGTDPNTMLEHCVIAIGEEVAKLQQSKQTTFPVGPGLA